MVNVTNPIVDTFLNNMSQLDARLATAQRQLSSGRRIEKPSDAPDVAADVVELQTELAQNSQVQSNLVIVKAEVDTGEQALERAMNLLDNASVLASQASTTIDGPVDNNTSPNTLANIAQQLGSIQSELVGLANTQANGKYVFSGAQDNTPAYSIDAAGNITQIATSAATRRITDSNGVSFAVGKTAQEIFDNPAGSVFAALSALKTAVASGSGAGVTSAMSALKTARDQVSSQLHYYGTVQNRIQTANDLASSVKMNRTEMLTQKRDADMAGAASDLAQIQIQRQAAMAAESQLPRKTLFDYIA